MQWTVENISVPAIGDGECVISSPAPLGGNQDSSRVRSNSDHSRLDSGALVNIYDGVCSYQWQERSTGT